MRISEWSSDVCSSDLLRHPRRRRSRRLRQRRRPHAPAGRQRAAADAAHAGRQPQRARRRLRLRPPTTRGTQMGTEKKSHDSANKPAAESRPGWLTRQLGGVYAWRDAIKEHPLKGTGLAVAIFVLGVLGNEAIGRVMEKFRDPDQFLVQMKDEQKQNFEALKTSLSELSGTLDSHGKHEVEKGGIGRDIDGNT